jgi:DedD protein
MADPQINPEEQALRRRARRRLIGSLALALFAVLVLPMIFEPEPKPLGDNVEIIIPGQDTPFNPAPPPSAPVVKPAPEVTSPDTPETETKETGDVPTRALTERQTPVEAVKPAPETPPKARDTNPVARKPEVKPVVSKPDTKPDSHPVPGNGGNPAKTNESKATESKATESKASESKASESKPTEGKSTETKPAAGAYALQLGSFSAEANARLQADKAKAAGYSVKVQAGQGVYKVRVGPYPSKEAALDAQAKLKIKGFAPVLVSP